ncbi:MAG TPA: ThiF family adenylyltransferase [Roseiarcus sp.]|nr:ThiF family adenylyltransferase [Roseiarcus sp.]
MTEAFDYNVAFHRNVGWVTRDEQQALRNKRVAVGGLGGCGGSHVLTIARMGIGRFTLADYDRFELVNFNRQAGAKVSTVGRPKLDVVREMALDINPELDIRSFPEGVVEGRIDEFLEGADVYVDAIDAFALEMRRKIHARCRALGIPAVLAVPAGMGAAFLIFMPDGMSLEDWYCFEDIEPSQRIVNFIVGTGPSGLHRSYLVDKSAVNLPTRDFPSTGLACEICAGVAAAQVVKVLLRRGKIEAVPYYHHFDAYKCVYKKGRIPAGNRNWLQRVKLALARREFRKLSHETELSTV